jgi:cytochrome c peroxidase
MKKIIAIITLSILYGCQPAENTETKTAARTSLMEEASNLFKSISSLPYENLPDNYQELNNPVNITSVNLNKMGDQAMLGKMLYFDTRLSKEGNISCNSCHNLDTYGVDNLPTSPGDEHKLGNRNSPTVLYASLHANQFWDGRAKDVEEQAGMPILNPVEHNIPSEKFLVDRLKGIPAYQSMFKKVYPKDADPITYKNLTAAIGAFERKLRPESRFDLWLNGDDAVLTDKEKSGLVTFINNGCVACHSGIAVGGQVMQKFGVYGNYWELTKSKNIDNGLYDITKNETDKYVFKAPSLRNIEKTAPYFHDGSVNDLADAVKMMGKLQNNKELSHQEVDEIVAFLKTLTADIDDQYKQ